MPPSAARRARLLGVVALAAVAAIVVTWLGWSYVAEERGRAIERWRLTLSGIADTREAAIEAWIDGRRGDAVVIAHYPTVVDLVNQPAGGPPRSSRGEGSAAHLQTLLDTVAGAYDYHGIWIVRDGRTLVSSSAAAALAPSEVAAAYELVAGAHPLGGFVEQGNLPVLLVATTVPAALPGAPARGLVVLEVDPRDYLYPLLAVQPFETTTVESLIAVPEGAAIVFLSPLRLRQDARPFARLPLSTPKLAAAELFQHAPPYGRFVDYRGVPILASTRRLKGTPWGLVVKVDESEALAAYRSTLAGTALAAASVLLALVGLGFGVVRNERARARVALARSDARFALLADHADDIILYLTLDGRILEANRRAVETYGYTRAELLAMNVRDLRVPETRDDVPRRLTRIAGVDHLRFDVEHVRKDGTRFPVEIHARRVTQGGEPVIVAILRDTTSRREQEAALRTAQQQFQQAQKLEAVGRLAAGVAHDFNNLLTVITGYADLLEGGRASRENADELRQIRDAADRAAGLTRQLLAFSRQQVLEPRVLNLNAVVEELAKLLQRVIGEDVTLVTRTNPALGNVEVDQGQIEQVLMNLAVNARDAMPEGGTLTIETDNQTVDGTHAAGHQPSQPGRYVLLAVTDTGVGMDADTQARIFEPFFTTKPAGQGTGLGLATVYGIVKQSGGFIWVSSEPGRGTTFQIYLPRVDREVAGTAPPARTTRDAGAGQTVLVVEDQPMLRTLVKRVLEAHGYRVVLAATGEEALTAGPGPDGIALLLSDVVLPDLPGPAVAERLRATRPELPVLFMSGYAPDAVEGRPLLDGRTSFLPKPFAPDQLLEKVREALDG